MLLAELIDASRFVSSTRSRLAKVAALARCVQAMDAGEAGIGVAYLCGDTRQGRVGVGYAALKEAHAAPASSGPRLSLADVDAVLSRVAHARGAGSAGERRRLLQELFAAATQDEQDFLGRLLLGELRQGALDGIMLEAIARAWELQGAQVRNAAMRAGGIAPVAQALARGGAGALEQFAMAVFRPVQPMLAQPADTVEDALASLGAAAFEWKLDGARVQVHRAGGEVRIYSRSLKDVTEAAPEIVAATRGLPGGDLILDGETIALHPGGTPYPFQETMKRFSRRREAAAVQAAMPLSVFFFDCLMAGGEDITPRAARERFERLGEIVPPELVVPRLVTSEAPAARALLAQALERGHEGLMAKSLDAPYQAGSRGSGWLKIKQANTLDLVVIAAEWGSGRRRGWLSNLHLAALDPDDGGFVMLGKTFKGMTDAMLRWQTKRLQDIALAQEGHVVRVRPELVVEVACNEIQASPHYPAGLALRFARVRGYREDKRAAEADTIDTVRALYERQGHRRDESR